MITNRSLSIHSLSKHRNVRLSSSRGQPALASPLIRTNRLDEKTSEHCRETKWREREREEKRERSWLRIRGERVIAVMFFFERGSNIFVRELRCCSRTRRSALAVCLSGRGGGWEKEREGEEGGTRKLRGDSHRTTHTIERKGHIGFSRLNASVCAFVPSVSEYDALRGSRTRYVTESVRILFRH